MAVRGQRFHIDLDLDSDDETDHPKSPNQASPAGSFFSLVKDVKERIPNAEAKPPSPPKIKSSETGFPAHKKRAKPSAFKQGIAKKPTNNGLTQIEDTSQKAPLAPQDPFRQHGQSQPTTVGEWVDSKSERQRISDENDQKLAQMSTEEIEEAQKELLSGLNPSVLEALLKKANIDDTSTYDRQDPTLQNEEQSSTKPKKQPKKVTFDTPEPTALTATQPDNTTLSNGDAPSANPSQDSHPPSEPQTTPSPSHPPDLDPSSPTFLSDLHTKYFPTLPNDPSRLSWMAPLPRTSSYSPTTPSLPPAALRFDFQGHLLPPRLSGQLPSTMGLHHHSSAPGSAGYTIPELAHLARSSFPKEGAGALCEGLWNEIEKGRVVDGLLEAAGKEGGFSGGNRSVWVTATEAVWNWRKGGGRRLK
ncbi:hypothetical protein G7Y79_00003g010720 [Physcia stellaris]|nr:hypothetical protein G7Y79_00003g010720 [Physcia stellaris]